MVELSFQFHLLLLILGLSSFATESLKFELLSSHTKCISEDIKSNSMTVGKYSVVNPSEGQPIPDSHKITVRVPIKWYKNPTFSIPNIEFGDFLPYLVVFIDGSFCRSLRLMGTVIITRIALNRGSLRLWQRRLEITWFASGLPTTSHRQRWRSTLIGGLVWLPRIGLMWLRKAKLM